MVESPPVPMLKNKKLRGIVQVLVSLGLLAWLIARAGPASIVSALAGLDWAWYLPAFLLFLLSVVLRAYRWHVLLRSLHDRAPFGQLVYLYFVGFFFNNFIPSGFGGDAVKVYSLYRQHGHGAEALSSVLMDRLTGLLGSSLVAVAVLAGRAVAPWLGLPAPALRLPPALVVTIAVVSLGIPLGFLLLRGFDPLAWLAERLPFTRRLTAHPALRRLFETVHRYPWPALWRALLISLPFTAILVAIQWCIARALAVDVPFALFPLFVPIISLLTLLPISFNGLGVREGAYQALFVPAGVASAEAIAMSLAFYVLRLSVGLIGGLLLAARGIRTVRSGSPDSA